MIPKKVYIVAKYSMKPRRPDQTFRPGYVKGEGNMQWDEHVDVTVGLKNRDLSMAQIIINISEQKVVKNSYGGDKSFMELFQYFYTSSPHELSQALRNCGITVSEPEEPTDEQSVQEDVPSEAEASERSESTAATDVAVSSKTTTDSGGEEPVCVVADTATAGTDQPAETRTTASQL